MMCLQFGNYEYFNFKGADRSEEVIIRKYTQGIPVHGTKNKIIQ